MERQKLKPAELLEAMQRRLHGYQTATGAACLVESVGRPAAIAWTPPERPTSCVQLENHVSLLDETNLSHRDSGKFSLLACDVRQVTDLRELLQEKERVVHWSETNTDAQRCKAIAFHACLTYITAVGFFGAVYNVSSKEGLAHVNAQLERTLASLVRLHARRGAGGHDQLRTRAGCRTRWSQRWPLSCHAGVSAAVSSSLCWVVRSGRGRMACHPRRSPHLHILLTSDDSNSVREHRDEVEEAGEFESFELERRSQRREPWRACRLGPPELRLTAKCGAAPCADEIFPVESLLAALQEELARRGSATCRPLRRR